MRPNSFERGEFFWSPARPADARHVRRDELGRAATVGAGGAGRPKATEAVGSVSKSLAQQVDAVTGSLRSWLLTGTRRIPIDPRRRQGEHEGLRLLLAEDEGSVDNSSQEISESMKRQAVVEALNRLPADENQVIKLAYFGGKTNDEIASTTGLPVSSVRRRLRDGLRQMQAHLESTGLVDMTRGAPPRGLASLLGWIVVHLYSRQRKPRTQGSSLFSQPNLSTALEGGIAPAAGVVAAVAAGGLLLASGPPHDRSTAALAPSRAAALLRTVTTHQAPRTSAPIAAPVAARMPASSAPATTSAGYATAAQDGREDGLARSLGDYTLMPVTTGGFGATSSIAISATGQIVPSATSTLSNTVKTATMTVSGVTRKVATVPSPAAIPSPPAIP